MLFGKKMMQPVLPKPASAVTSTAPSKPLSLIEDKELRKKLRNRQSALAARERKKARMLQLEQTVAELQRSNEKLSKENVELKHALLGSRIKPTGEEIQCSRIQFPPVDIEEKFANEIPNFSSTSSIEPSVMQQRNLRNNAKNEDYSHNSYRRQVGFLREEDMRLQRVKSETFQGQFYGKRRKSTSGRFFPYLTPSSCPENQQQMTPVNSAPPTVVGDYPVFRFPHEAFQNNLQSCSQSPYINPSFAPDPSDSGQGSPAGSLPSIDAVLTGQNAHSPTISNHSRNSSLCEEIKQSRWPVEYVGQANRDCDFNFQRKTTIPEAFQGSNDSFYNSTHCGKLNSVNNTEHFGQRMPNPSSNTEQRLEDDILDWIPDCMNCYNTFH